MWKSSRLLIPLLALALLLLWSLPSIGAATSPANTFEGVKCAASPSQPPTLESATDGDGVDGDPDDIIDGNRAAPTTYSVSGMPVPVADGGAEESMLVSLAKFLLQLQRLR